MVSEMDATEQPHSAGPLPAGPTLGRLWGELRAAPDAAGAVALSAAGITCVLATWQTPYGFWFRPLAWWAILPIVLAAVSAAWLLATWAYMKTGGPGAAPGRVARRLAWAVAAACAAGAACLNAKQELFLTAYLYAPLCLGAFALAAAALLPGPTAAVGRRLLALPLLRGRTHVLWALMAGAAAVIAGELLVNLIYYGQVNVPLWPASVAMNAAILLCLALLLLAATNRLGVSLLLALAAYAVLMAADILKLLNLHCPVRANDLLVVADLRVLLPAAVGAGTIAAVAGGAVAFATAVAVLWRLGRPALGARRRVLAAAAALVGLALLFGVPAIGGVTAWLQGRLIHPFREWDARESARHNGVLAECALRWSEGMLRRPAGYGRAAIEALAARRGLLAASRAAPPPDQRANLIVILVESFTDPLQFGVPLTRDPMPALRRAGQTHTRGRVVVPTYGGMSVNTELEVLTGMAMYFLPRGSCPYCYWVNRDIPTLPRLLGRRGWRSEAFLTDPPYLFSRKTVLPHMGFDRWTFLLDDPNVPRDVTDTWASDEAVVDALLAAVRRGGGPVFLYAFPGSTHTPYDPRHWPGSDLDVAGELPGPASRDLKGYVNALAVMDRALGRLLAGLETIDRRTIVLIMGDHMPPFAGTRSVYHVTGYYSPPGVEGIRRRQEVPAILWSNRPLRRQPFRWSANFVPVHLLAELGVPPDGLLALAAAAHSRFAVLSRYVETADGGQFLPNDPAIPHGDILRDYRLLQYDLLKGEGHFPRLAGEAR